jgi:D-3-phosphoglycerate dehydrogenase / 2-oxoglutarate reductase
LADAEAPTRTVVAIDHRFGDVAVEEAVLREVGARVVDAEALPPDAAAAACVDAEAILIGPRLRFDEERIGALQRCRVIVRYGVGYDNVDVAAASARGIAVAIVPDYCVEEVATHALAMILALNRQLAALDHSVREGRWQIGERSGIRRLSESTLGIVGFGRIGEALGRRALALGMRVVATDPARPADEIEGSGARAVALAELLASSDFVSVHAAKSADAPPILDAGALAQMKPTAYVVNVARGGLVDEVALDEALRSGRLAGAALDTLDPEPPPPDAPLLTAPNVLVTPHAAWYSSTAIQELRRKAAEEAARVLAGGTARNPVGV